eukprot:1608718-Amphidinium_carterae.1
MSTTSKLSKMACDIACAVPVMNTSAFRLSGRGLTLHGSESSTKHIFWVVALFASIWRYSGKVQLVLTEVLDQRADVLEGSNTSRRVGGRLYCCIAEARPCWSVDDRCRSVVGEQQDRTDMRSDITVDERGGGQCQCDECVEALVVALEESAMSMAFVKVLMPFDANQQLA